MTQSALRFAAAMAYLPALAGAWALESGWTLPALSLTVLLMAVTIPAIRQPWQRLAVSPSFSLTMTAHQDTSPGWFLGHRWIGTDWMVLRLRVGRQVVRALVWRRGQREAFRALAAACWGRAGSGCGPAVPNGHRSSARSVV